MQRRRRSRTRARALRATLCVYYCLVYLPSTYLPTAFGAQRTRLPYCNRRRRRRQRLPLYKQRACGAYTAGTAAPALRVGRPDTQRQYRRARTPRSAKTPLRRRHGGHRTQALSTGRPRGQRVHRQAGHASKRDSTIHVQQQ